MRELFHLSYWLTRTYAKGDKAGIDPDVSPPRALPLNRSVPAERLEQLNAAAARYVEAVKAREESEAARRASDEDRARLEAEIAGLQAEVAAARAANSRIADAHDYDEATTRDAFIDLLLREVGWTFSKPGHDTEFPVTGMPNQTGDGYVDYVLWGDDGKPLGLVEAKRTKKDARVGQQQAKLYADCLEAQFGQRPVIFYSNGYDHWIWDDKRYPPRAIAGFLTKDELELAIRRRQSMKALGRHRDQSGHRRALLPDPRHPTGGRGLRKKTSCARALLGDGHRLRQDAHGDRAVGPDAERQLGAADSISGRSPCAGEPGGGGVQEVPAFGITGQSDDREVSCRPGLCIDLSNNDEPDRQRRRRCAPVRPRAFRPDRRR